MHNLTNWPICPNICFFRTKKILRTFTTLDPAASECRLQGGQKFRVVLLLIFTEKMGATKLLHLFGFRRLRDLMANICWTKRDTDNQAKALESTKGLLHCRKISWTLVYKRLKTGPEFLLTLLFCFVPVHRTPSMRHNVAPHSVRLQLRFEASKDVKLEMLSRPATLSGNT